MEKPTNETLAGPDGDLAAGKYITALQKHDETQGKSLELIQEWITENKKAGHK